MISYNFIGPGAPMLSYLVEGRDYALLINALMG